MGGTGLIANACRKGECPFLVLPLRFFISIIER